MDPPPGLSESPRLEGWSVITSKRRLPRTPGSPDPRSATGAVLSRQPMKAGSPASPRPARTLSPVPARLVKATGATGAVSSGSSGSTGAVSSGTTGATGAMSTGCFSATGVALCFSKPPESNQAGSSSSDPWTQVLCGSKLDKSVVGPNSDVGKHLSDGDKETKALSKVQRRWNRGMRARMDSSGSSPSHELPQSNPGFPSHVWASTPADLPELHHLAQGSETHPFCHKKLYAAVVECALGLNRCATFGEVVKALDWYLAPVQDTFLEDTSASRMIRIHIQTAFWMALRYAIGLSRSIQDEPVELTPFGLACKWLHWQLRFLRGMRRSLMKSFALIVAPNANPAVLALIEDIKKRLKRGIPNLPSTLPSTPESYELFYGNSPLGSFRLRVCQDIWILMGWLGIPRDEYPLTDPMPPVQAKQTVSFSVQTKMGAVILGTAPAHSL